MADFIEGLIDLGNGNVKINFHKVSEDGIYRYQDALHFTKEQYEQLSEEQIEQMKQQRFDNWFTYVTGKKEPQEEPQEEINLSNSEIIDVYVEDSNQ